MINKRIAVISYHTCPLSDEKDAEIGGMNVYVLELSKELAKKGYVVDIFTRAVDEKSPRIVQVTSNLRVIHLAAGKQARLPKKLLINYINEFLRNFYRFLASENVSYDLFSCHYYLSGLIGLQIKKKFNIPFVVTFHTLALMKNLVARDEEEKEEIQRIKAEKLLMEKADKVIATSQTDKEYMHTLYNCSFEKISVLIPGINFELFHPIEKNKAKEVINAEKNRKLILFVGRIVPLKGIDALFYALKILLEKNPSLKISLFVVGGGKSEKSSTEYKRLSEIINLLKIKTHVRFAGPKKQKELLYFYNASEIVIMPSHYESFGIIALEAMACGVPVITTDVSGISGLFDKKHDSLITSAGNPILLSKKIENLLENEKEHEKISKELLKKVSDLDWSKTADKFIRENLIR